MEPEEGPLHPVRGRPSSFCVSILSGMRVSLSGSEASVLPPGCIQDAWQQEEGERSELAQHTSHWLALVPVATCSRNGGWESGSLTGILLTYQNWTSQGKGWGRIDPTAVLGVLATWCFSPSSDRPVQGLQTPPFVGLGEINQERHIFPIFSCCVSLSLAT